MTLGLFTIMGIWNQAFARSGNMEIKTIKNQEKKERVVKKEVPKSVKMDQLFKKMKPQLDSLWGTHNVTIPIGEEWKYKVKYLGITMGELIFTRANDSQWKGERFHLFRARVKSAPFYAAVYELDDTVETYMHPKTFLPHRYVLKQRESSQEVDDFQEFNPKTKQWTVDYTKHKKGKLNKKFKKSVKAPSKFQDSFSILPFIMGLPFKVGARWEVPVVTRGKLWIMKAHVDWKGEVKVMQNWFNAFRVQVETHYPGVLKSQGNMTVWFEQGKIRKFLKFKAKVKIGHVEGDLISKFRPY